MILFLSEMLLFGIAGLFISWAAHSVIEYLWPPWRRPEPQPRYEYDWQDPGSDTYDPLRVKLDERAAAEAAAQNKRRAAHSVQSMIQSIHDQRGLESGMTRPPDIDITNFDSSAFEYIRGILEKP